MVRVFQEGFALTHPHAQKSLNKLRKKALRSELYGMAVPKADAECDR